MQNGALVPPDYQKSFTGILYKMVNKSTTVEEFDTCVSQLHSQFSQIDGWLSWWLCPKIASMIFPAKSAVNVDLARKVPSTTNPVEAQHSNFHSATGKDFDAVAGAHNLYLYIKTHENQYRAIMVSF